MKNLRLSAAMAACVLSLLTVINVPVAFTQGTLDPAFGTNGSVTTKIQTGRDDVGQSITTQPDGKIVVAGNSFNIIGYSNIGVVRYNKNGKLDKTFNITGKKVINDGFCNVVLVQTDGKILIGGSVAIGNTTAFGLWRMNSDGSMDNTFGTNGYQTVSFPAGYVICFAMALQPDGKILIGGNDGNYYAGNSSLALARLTPTGALDNTFSGDGKYTLNLIHKSLACQKILLQPNGKIIAAGQLDTIIDPNFHDEFFAARLNIDGTIDNTFGTGGIVREKNSTSSTSDVCYSAALRPDGKIVLAGMSKTGISYTSSILCLNNDGSVNSAFGTSGWQNLSFYGATGILYTTLAQKNNKIIVVGSVAGSSIGVARFTTTGQPDASFANAGLDTFIYSPGHIGANDAIMERNGNILVTGFKTITTDYFLTARILNTAPYQKELSDASTSSIEDVMVYPVPVHGNTIQLVFNAHAGGDMMISIFDISGRLVITPVHEEVAQGTNSHQVTLPAGLPGGEYFISINLNGEIKNTRFIIE
jgi:uncharacterized delta-60 repeat protein